MRMLLLVKSWVHLETLTASSQGCHCKVLLVPPPVFDSVFLQLVGYFTYSWGRRSDVLMSSQLSSKLPRRW
jgi:hypothetical protein